MIENHCRLRNKRQERIDLSGSTKLRELTAAELAEEQKRGTLLLDTRPAEQFAALHIRGSIQISLLGHFAGWAAILIDPAQNILIVGENEKSAQEAVIRLTRVGLTLVVGYSRSNEQRWRRQGLELASIATHKCVSIGPILNGDAPPQLVDVRSRAEWLEGHLPGAISLPLLELNAKASLVDPTKTSLVYCQEGYRATTAASMLLRGNAANVGILIDGVEGWSACGLPLESSETR